MLSRIVEGRWRETEYGKPASQAGISPLAQVLAELAWPELQQLEPGQFARFDADPPQLSGTFYKVDANTVECHLDSGQSGSYKHDSDEQWRLRRKRVRSLIG